jgi:hypothetical protein
MEARRTRARPRNTLRTAMSRWESAMPCPLAEWETMSRITSETLPATVRAACVMALLPEAAGRSEQPVGEHVRGKVQRVLDEHRQACSVKERRRKANSMSGSAVDSYSHPPPRGGVAEHGEEIPASQTCRWKRSLRSSPSRAMRALLVGGQLRMLPSERLGVAVLRAEVQRAQGGRGLMLSSTREVETGSNAPQSFGITPDVHGGGDVCRRRRCVAFRCRSPRQSSGRRSS